MCLAVEHFAPTYGDDDDISPGWRVMKETGPINDREWVEAARGEHPPSTTLRALFTQERASEQPHFRRQHGRFARLVSNSLRDTDGSPEGRDAARLDGEAATAGPKASPGN
ncbi:hypothetical protein AB5I41_31135 [Sphingomonas sp. MMS24-JH45]